MRVATGVLRKGFCALTLLSVGVGAAVVLKTPTSAADADLYAFSAANSVANLSRGLSTAGQYAFGPATCTSASLPTPIATTVPGYLDIPLDEGGRCPSVSGTGTLVVAHCDKGAITANWTFTEPAGDTVAFNGAGVILGGVAVIAAPPVAGDGYFDPAPTSTPGGAVAVAVFTTDDPLNSVCGVADSKLMDLVVAGVAAVYTP